LGELKDVLIHLSSNSKVHQTIDIIIDDILEAYGVILSRDWSAKLNGYFATNWSHLWLPYKGQLKKIKVEHECYIKHIVIDLNDTIESVMFSNSILGNFYFDTFFPKLEVEFSPLANFDMQFEILHITHIVEPHCTILETCKKIDSNNCTDVVSSSTNISIELTDPHIWTLYFDGSKNKEGEGIGFLLIDPHGNNTMLGCRLEQFYKIKEAIVKAPTLRSPNFDKEFILYNFSSDH